MVNGEDEEIEEKNFTMAIRVQCRGGGRIKSRKKVVYIDVKRLALAMQNSKQNPRKPKMLVDWAAVTREYYGKDRRPYAHLQMQLRNMYYRYKQTIDQLLLCANAEEQRTQDEAEVGDKRDPSPEVDVPFKSVDIDQLGDIDNLASLPPTEPSSGNGSYVSETSVDETIPNNRKTVESAIGRKTSARNTTTVRKSRKPLRQCRCKLRKSIGARHARTLGILVGEAASVVWKRVLHREGDILPDPISHKLIDSEVGGLVSEVNEATSCGNNNNMELLDSSSESEISLPGQKFPKELTKALSRNRIGIRNVNARIKRKNLRLKLPVGWKAMLFDKGEQSNRLSSDGREFIINFLSQQNKFCIFQFGYQHKRTPGSRKKGTNYLKGDVVCGIPECKFKATYYIPNEESEHIFIEMAGEVFHKKYSVRARRIAGPKREALKSLFKENRSTLPSEIHREDLSNIDPDSFGAGNLSAAGKNHVAYQQLAAKTRKEADSVGVIHADISDLQDELKKEDEKHAIKQGATYRRFFGYIQKPIITLAEISIILIDEPMVMLYHELAKNSTLYVDATGSVVRNVKGFKKILYYAATLRHPYNSGPPLPIAEYITSNHDQYSIKRFFGTIHELENLRYGNEKLSNPKLILLDYSLAIIHATLSEFCSETLTNYIDRTYKVVTGAASADDLSKTFLHVCSFHMMRIGRKHAAKHSGDGDEGKSKIHFALRVLGRLINSSSLDDATATVRDATIVLNARFESENVKSSLRRLEERINTFEAVSIKSDSDVDFEGLADENSEKHNGRKSKNEKGGGDKSEMHKYWESILEKIGHKVTEDKGPEKSLNRYYLPFYCDWLHSKLPHITLWSNLCLGDLNKYNKEYRCSIPDVTSNAVAEQFFSIKKRNKQNLALPLANFIRKCYNDNKGLQRQFILGLKEQLVGKKSADKDIKKSYTKVKRLLTTYKETSGSDNELTNDRRELNRHFEAWDKSMSGKATPKKRERATFQEPPRKKLKFSATLAEKRKRVEQKRRFAKHRGMMADAAKNSTAQNTKKYSPPSAKDIGYKLLKREKYEQLADHEKDDMATVRARLINLWSSLTPELRTKYNNEAKAKKDKCAICLEDEVEGSQEDILWVLCDECDKWYHIECVFIDAVYSIEIPRYSCPECLQQFRGGLPSFINHYRYANPADFGEKCDPLALWRSTTDNQKKIITENIYPPNIDDSYRLGRLDLFSERGIFNKCNNCWANAAFQILCGSILSKLLPTYESCKTDVCQWLLKIRNDLQKETSTPMKFTNAMKSVVSSFRKDQNRQDDAGSFVEEILLHLINNSVEDLDERFTAKISTIHRCSTCKKEQFGMRQSAMIDIPIWNVNIPDVSLQSLLYDTCMNGDIFNSFACKCAKEHRTWEGKTYFVRLPVAFIISINRVRERGVLVHTPLQVNETLFLDHMLPGRRTKESAVYRLAAVVAHNGQSSEAGHYTSVLFNDHGEGIEFNDINQQPVLLENYIGSTQCKENCRMLVYINVMALTPDDGRPCSPWRTEMQPCDIFTVERWWFGIAGDKTETDIPLELFRSVMGNHHLHSDIIMTFLSYISSNFSDKYDISVLPSELYTAISKKRKKSAILDRSLAIAHRILKADVVFIPCHHEFGTESGHWTLTALFPTKKLAVHCDSDFSEDSKKSVCKAISVYLGKALKQLGQCEEIKCWEFLALGECGLQQQTDVHSCGVFLCLNAYNLLTLTDINVADTDLNSLRYWIGKCVLEGPKYCSDEREKCKVEWDQICCEAPYTFQDCDVTIPNGVKTPFTLLNGLLNKRVRKRNLHQEAGIDDSDTESISQAEMREAFFGKKKASPVYRTLSDISFQSSSDSEKDNNEKPNDKDHPTEEDANSIEYLENRQFTNEFLSFARKDIRSFVEEFNRCCDNERAFASGQYSERLTALMTLKAKHYRGLANGEFLHSLPKSFGGELNRIKLGYHSICLQYNSLSSDSDLKIAKWFGQSRAGIIDLFFFPEHVTTFIMSKYKLSYEEATGRIYGSTNPCRTVFGRLLDKANGTES